MENYTYSVDSVQLTIYRDGLVHVDQILTVNESILSFNITLLTSSIENVIVVNENDSLLLYEMMDENMTVFSLGAGKVSIEYDTDVLTEKEAGVWTIAFEAPYSLTLTLPEESTIIYLSDVPTSIRTKDNKTILELYSGPWEVSYVLPVIPPTPTPTSTPTPTPTPSITPFPTPTPSPTATPTTTPVVSPTPSFPTPTVSPTVTPTIPTVSPTPTPTPSPTPPITTPTTTPSPIPTERPDEESLFPLFVLVVIGFLVATSSTVYLWSKRGVSRVEAIFWEHPGLSSEERAVIKYIDECGGEAFESQIRKRFGLPKTSVWRMARRLTEKEILTVKKVGRQNKLELKK